MPIKIASVRLIILPKNIVFNIVKFTHDQIIIFMLVAIALLMFDLMRMIGIKSILASLIRTYID